MTSGGDLRAFGVTSSLAGDLHVGTEYRLGQPTDKDVGPLEEDRVHAEEVRRPYESRAACLTVLRRESSGTLGSAFRTRVPHGPANGPQLRHCARPLIGARRAQIADGWHHHALSAGEVSPEIVIQR